MLEPAQAQELKRAGLDYYNHNLDTSEEFYGADHLDAQLPGPARYAQAVRDAGLNVCCGGIVGMGESQRDRAQLLVTLANLPQHPESVPINQLVRVPGTPLAQAPDTGPVRFRAHHRRGAHHDAQRRRCGSRPAAPR
jgi:biotin synthase